MIFYILTAIAVIAIIIIVVRGVRHWSGFDDEDGWVIFGVVILWAAIACGLTSCVQAAIPPSHTDVQRHGLTALANRTDQPGAYFFLGSGVVGEEEVYRYIERDSEGGNRMKDVGVRKAVVYETNEEPSVEIARSYSDQWWLTPWTVDSFKITEYRFYIPERSIARGYEVTP